MFPIHGLVKRLSSLTVNPIDHHPIDHHPIERIAKPRLISRLVTYGLTIGLGIAAIVASPRAIAQMLLFKDEFRQIPTPAVATIVAPDPKFLVYRLFPTKELPRWENLSITYGSGEDQAHAVALLTVVGLRDDSVAAARYYIDLEQQESGAWAIVWVGQQVICQPGRGSRRWTTEFCL